MSAARRSDVCSSESTPLSCGISGLDPRHPLYRPPGTPPVTTGSWSIRIDGGGHHVSHVHPGGRFSSTCHIVAPAADGDAGHLELGRPPADIALALSPLASFAPLPAQLVLFPSFLYHGTVAFGAGEQLSVALDIA